MTSIESNFKGFSLVGDKKGDGKTLNFKATEKWLKKGKMINGKLNSKKAEEIFNKYNGGKGLDQANFLKYVDECCKTSGQDKDASMKRLGQASSKSKCLCF